MRPKMRLKLFCKHDFKLLTTFESDADKSIGYKLEQYYVVYCPKCKLQKIMNKLSYDIMINKRKVDKEYADKKSDGNRDTN